MDIANKESGVVYGAGDKVFEGPGNPFQVVGGRFNVFITLAHNGNWLNGVLCKCRLEWWEYSTVGYSRTARNRETGAARTGSIPADTWTDVYALTKRLQRAVGVTTAAPGFEEWEKQRCSPLSRVVSIWDRPRFQRLRDRQLWIQVGVFACTAGDCYTVNQGGMKEAKVYQDKEGKLVTDANEIPPPPSAWPL